MRSAILFSKYLTYEKLDLNKQARHILKELVKVHPKSTAAKRARLVLDKTKQKKKSL